MRVVIGAVVLIAVAVASDARAGDSPRAIAAIENDLVADDPAVRAKAAGELTDRFPDGAVAVPMLVDLLDDESPEVVAAAAKAIDAMAVAGAGVLGAYLGNEAQWKPESPLSRVMPALFAAGIGAKLLRPDEVGAGSTPAEPLALVALLPPKESLAGADRSVETSLVTILRKATGPRRDLCAAALSMRGFDAATRVRRAEPAASPRRDAAQLTALQLLRSKRDLQRWSGARIVARLRPSDADVIKALLEILATPHAAEANEAALARVGCYQALAAIGAPATSAAPWAMEALSTESDEVLRLVGARAVACIGSDADVTKWATGDDDVARSIAIAAAQLSRVPDALVHHFVNGLAGTAENERTALVGIASIGPAAAPALKTLKERAPTDAKSARSPSAVRRCALYANAILAVDPADAAAFRVLHALDEDIFAWKMLEAYPGRPIDVLASRAAPTPELVAVLRQYAETADENVEPCSLRALHGIARCRQVAAPIAPVLIKLLSTADTKSRDPATAEEFGPARRGIAVALGHIGPDAAAAVPALTALRDKGDETIRVPAAQALRRIKAKR